MSRILVDNFQEDHIQAAIELWQSTPGVGLTPSDTIEHIKRFLKRNPTSNFIASKNGTLIGTVLCGHDGRRGYIHHLAVEKQHRQQGVASTLIDSALHALFLEDIHKCHSFAFRDNIVGNAFWGNSKWERRDDLAVYSSRLR